jgi:hypothetical protein
MPLVRAHAEYVKLLRSLRDGKVFDLPPQTAERYLVAKTRSPFAFQRFNHKCRSMPCGKTLRVETPAPALVHWSADAWHHTYDTPTRDTGLGVSLRRPRDRRAARRLGAALHLLLAGGRPMGGGGLRARSRGGLRRGRCFE